MTALRAIVPARQRGLRARAARAVLLTTAGLVLAGIVHIVTVLSLPDAAQNDATATYAGLGTAGHAELVTPPPDGLPATRDADAATVVAACGINLTNGPVRIRARAGAQPLSLSVHRRGGGVAYAITDRAAVRGVLAFVVLTQEQLDERLAEAEDDQPADAARELRVISPTEEALLVARALVPAPSQREEATALVTGVECGPEDD